MEPPILWCPWAIAPLAPWIIWPSTWAMMWIQIAAMRIWQWQPKDQLPFSWSIAGEYLRVLLTEMKVPKILGMSGWGSEKIYCTATESLCRTMHLWKVKNLCYNAVCCNGKSNRSRNKPRLSSSAPRWWNILLNPLLLDSIIAGIISYCRGIFTINSKFL